MRLNRQTIIFIVIGLVIIFGAVMLSNQESTPAEPTPTAAAEGAGPIFPAIAEDAAQTTLVRFEVTNNETAEKTVVTKNDEGIWAVEEASFSSDLDTDQTKAVGTIGVLASLEAVQSFTTDDLAQFGLDAPTHTFVLTDEDGATYTLQVGDKNPATPRYYVLVNDNTQTVYVVPQDLVDGLVRQILVPPYVASPTPTVTPTITPNPFSEVEQTATAEIEQTVFAQIQQTMIAETLAPTSEPTVEAAEVEATATLEPTDAPTDEPTTAPTDEPTTAPTRTPRPSSTPRPTATP